MKRQSAGLAFAAAGLLLAAVVTGVFLGAASRDNRLTVDPDRKEPAGSLPHRPRETDVVKFGFDPRLDPVEEARIYIPLLTYLERKTGRRFELRFTKRNESIVDNLGNDLVQFAAIGSVSFIKARQGYGVVSVARGLNADRSATYRSAVFTRPGSPVERLADLRGRSFAFGDVNSTQGHLIPRLMLQEAGLDLGDLSRFEYTGSHRKCAEAVISGFFDAGGMQDTLALELEKRGLIRVVAWSARFPGSGIAASPNVSIPLREAVRTALLEFDPAGKDREGLYHWERTEMAGGFAEADDGAYDMVLEELGRLGRREAGR